MTISLAGCQGEQSSAGDPSTYLARTATVLKTATATARPTFKILFYGQSITSTKWTDRSAAYLRRQYPNVDFVFYNKAIGGNDASLLERAAARDLDEVYPDLVVFHVYGDEHAYERILRDIRSRTAADVILQTDHVRDPVEPVCPIGLRLRWTVPDGCEGQLRLRQRHWDNYMSGHIIPVLSRRYGVAIDERRRMWQRHLMRHGIPYQSLLADGLHPNDAGWSLAAKLFDASFRHLIDTTPVGETRSVRTIPIGELRNGMLSFEGNRVELIATRPLSGDYRASIDAVPATAVAGCWQTTRVSEVPWISGWPAIRQVTIQSRPLEADEWTAELSRFSPDLKNFRFRLHSRRHGDDGSGQGDTDFVSPSGRVAIEAADWAFDYAQRVKPVDPPHAITLRWSRRFACDRTSVVGPNAGGGDYRYVVATGLTNGTHRMTIDIPRSDRDSVRAVTIFRPPLSGSGS